MNIVCIGDLVGDPGKHIFLSLLTSLREQYKIDALIVNGENIASDGKGITPTIAESLIAVGVDVITTGNHVWHKKEIYEYIAQSKRLLRPANFPSGYPGTGCPGTGVTCVPLANGMMLGVINILGRVFMKDLVGCPLRTAETALTFLSSKTKHIIVDVHAETTSEKAAVGYFLDGKISGVVGTHTHVQTADERILPQGTAYITDLGMGGAIESMIGMKRGPIVQSYLTQMPTRFAVETEGPMQLCGVCIETDNDTGKAINIKRFKIVRE